MSQTNKQRELRRQLYLKKRRQRKIQIAMIMVATLMVITLITWGGIVALKSITKSISSKKNEINFKAPSMITRTDFSITAPKKEATLTVVGDIMMHEWQLERAYNPDTDSFDCSDMFPHMEKYLSHADMTIGNLETTLPGRNNGANSDIHGFSGYPMFSAPECLADHIKDVGFDFLQTANNHSLDSWEDGIYSTIDVLDQKGLKHTGTFKSKEESEELCIEEINGIKFGFVAYTYATNGLPVPEERPYCINTLDLYDETKLEEMYAKVRALDEAGCDFVCPLIHFGTEYVELPDSWQEMVVDGLFEAGADVIFGGHPHVVEPMDVRTITNPDGTTRTGYVMYSYGNFISSQYYDGVNKDLGILSDFTFTKEVVDGKSNCYVSDIKVEPTYVYWTDSTIAVVPVLEAYNNQDKFSFLSAKDWDRITFAKDHVIELLMTYGNFDYSIDNDMYVITPKNNTN